MADKKIDSVEGIGPVYAEKLGAAGYTSTDKLLEAGASKAGRKKIAEETGLKESQILVWVNMCDLFRVNGVAGQFAELLKASGVDTVKELRTRNAENLAAKMAEVNEEKKLTRQVPSAKVVTGWVEQAKELPPMLTY